jgi:hypothetical protein
VQIADTYVHLVINAVSVERLSIEPGIVHQLSKRLAPWYFNTDDTYGTSHNKFLWSSDLQFNNGTNVIAMANKSLHREATDKIDSHVFNYTNTQGISHIIVHPPNIDRSLDWQGTGYSISTQCYAIPASDCQISNVTSVEPTFSCAVLNSLGENITGQLTTYAHETWVDDWHQYIREDKPFANKPGQSGIQVDESFSRNMTLEDSNAVFRNPWHWLGKALVRLDDSELPQAFHDSKLVMRVAVNELAFLLMCNTTGTFYAVCADAMADSLVFDATYTLLNNQVASLSVSKSNGSVAGLVSMLSLDTLDTMGIGLNMAVIEANDNSTTPEAFISKYELAMSKALSVALVVHTVPALTELVQRRVNQVITRLPALALWLLVTANILFALLGLVLGLLAARAASPDVHQVHLRLSTAGLAAQLFDAPHAQLEAEKDVDLFRENGAGEGRDEGKKVSVRCTAVGGAEFITHGAVDRDAGDDQSQLISRESH